VSLLKSFDGVRVLSAAFVVIISLTALVGWATDSHTLRGLALDLPTMKINAAVGFLLGALSLITLHRKTLPKSVGWMFAFGMTLIGALTLCEYLVGLDLGIDQLIVNDFTSRPGVPPGRMAMVTALNFSLVGIALILLHRRSSQRAVQAWTLPPLCITFLSFGGYLFDSRALTRLAHSGSMALNTTIGFAGLCCGILCAIPDVGLVAAISLPGISGALARRLIPAAVIVPLFLGFVRLRGQQMGLYGTEFGVAIFAVASCSIMVTLILWSVNSLSRLEVAKEKSSEELRTQRDILKRQAELINLANDAIVIADAKRVITGWNGGAEKLYGWKESEAVGQLIHRLLQTASTISTEEIDNLLRTNNRWEGELIHIRKDGRKVVVDSRQILPETDIGAPGSFLEINRDITDRKELQEQLLQSQKLESLGQLAGGVAHDFNNLLTVIIGYSDFILEQLPANHAVRSEVEQIAKAGARASSLTRQLLTFSRRQVTSPINLTLNNVVLGLEKMLNRLISEDIQLTISLDQTPSVILADPGQIEQVVMNLVVNARDAMPNGGKLMIETATANVDEGYAESHLSINQGTYAVLIVSDNGTGMSPEVKEHIFEPFFTTKEVGKGTGLGLSTVYGIVKQSGGGIFVYSEPGLGTTFKMFFPAVNESVSQSPAKPTAEGLDGTETILLAEDEEPLRKFVHEALARHGYNVIVCSNGQEALMIARQHQGKIHLLVSDVVMPEVGGSELLDAFSLVRPGVPALLMSGYSDRMRRKDINAKLLQKPFTGTDLLREIRSILPSHQSGTDPDRRH